ncbi:MAG: hypothetical protein NTV22_11815 [bacterium]|nr:hypothetical protein [bacterium]
MEAYARQTALQQLTDKLENDIENFTTDPHSLAGCKCPHCGKRQSWMRWKPFGNWGLDVSKDALLLPFENSPTVEISFAPKN